jgi:nicotinamidase-related amidase
MDVRRTISLLLISSAFFLSAGQAQNERLRFEGRYLKENARGFTDKQKKISWKPEETAIIICDMWDQHWCETATQRVKEMAPRMNQFVSAARALGVTIIHAPSNTMDFYASYPQRMKMKEVEAVPSSTAILDWYSLDPDREPALPIDDSDGGCDDPQSDCVNCVVWKKQIDLLEIKDQDGISDSGREINNYFIRRGIRNVIIMGVHTNMCVLGRSFGIRSHVNQGRNVVLVRDLTDAMYNPEMHPKASHKEGTSLVINHIEKFWCPTITSDQLLTR